MWLASDVWTPLRTLLGAGETISFDALTVLSTQIVHATAFNASVEGKEQEIHI
jgi:hypothetical protein